tara:strand:+ start:4242 stop:4526 length:285 start_codon:yes stop_codon:yes gene_type:complete
MAKRKFKPQPNQAPPQQQVQVDLSQAETMKCEHCGNVVFIKGTVLKRLSAIVSPTGQEAIVPIEIYSCGSCGEVPKSMMKDIGLETEEKNPLSI